MRVMDCAELLQYVEQRMDYYLENKPEHDNGFCWWLDSTSEDVIASISMTHNVTESEYSTRPADAYCVMQDLTDRYFPESGGHRAYLSDYKGYNEVRANHLRNIRDTILIPRIKELS
jgi:hypothetical protein